jgi:hypothetical protein
MPTQKLHQQFVAALRGLADPAAVADVSRFFRADPNGHSGGNKIPGVSIGKVFPVAKRFIDMPLGVRSSDRSTAPTTKSGWGQ